MQPRREHFDSAARALLPLAVAPFLTSPLPASAEPFDKQNKLLKVAGLPPVKPDDVPKGFNLLVDVLDQSEIYGRVRERDPVIVQFVYPSSWLVVRPVVDKNGQSGTITAGNQKTETAALFVVPNDTGAKGKLKDQPMSFWEGLVGRWISQKGETSSGLKILSKYAAEASSSDEYMVVNYRYELATGAGFTVYRRGVGAVTTTDKSVECLFTATTEEKFRKVGPTLQKIVDSFRCYQDREAIKGARLNKSAVKKA